MKGRRGRGRRDIPDTAFISVVQSFLVSEKIKATGVAVMSHLVVLVQAELTEGLREVVVKMSRGGGWAGQLVVQGMVSPACVKHVDNGILPLVGRVVARRVIFLGSGGYKVLAATFDAVRRGINSGNDLVRNRITCYVSQERLSAGITRRQHDTNERLGLMKAGLDGINVALGRSALPGWSEKSTGCNNVRMGDVHRKKRTGAKQIAVLAGLRGSQALALAF